MATAISFSRFSYGVYAQQFLKIDMTDDGQLYVDVPGMGGDWFRVSVNEEGLVPVATHCRCSHHQHKGTCAHTEIVDSFYSRIYKSSIVKASEKALEQAMDASDAIEEVYEVAELTEQIAATEGLENFSTVEIAQPVATHKPVLKVVKIDYHSAYTASFFSALPSRQKSTAA